MSEMRRREFITLLGGMATGWPFAARAQQPTTMPVIGLINAGIRESAAYRMTDFRHGLNEAGYVEGQSVTIEYRWAEGRYDLMPELVADLLNRQVAIIATPDSTAAALAAKAATASVPIVFGDGEDPIKLGLVSSLARPGGNVTGAAAPATELEGKRLRLLRELVPAGSIGVLVNPASPASDAYWKDIQEASRAVRQEINILHASNEHEIDFAFTIAASRRPGALIVAPDAFFDSRHKLLVRRAETHAIPAIALASSAISRTSSKIASALASRARTVRETSPRMTGGGSCQGSEGPCGALFHHSPRMAAGRMISKIAPLG
jgi:putative tryptophan/tyrosine transport system substrate-binding protein